MEVQVVPLLELYRPEPGWRAVVIDVLRFTTCVAAAVAAGCEALVPCETPEEARERRQGRGLLAGERGSVPLPGFDLGNSPFEFVPEAVAGRTIYVTTTNGTRAVRTVGEGLLAALVNRRAVVERLGAGGASVRIVCSGNSGALSAEDWIAAGAILAGLRDAGRAVQADDAARLAEASFRHAEGDLPAALAGTDHGRSLVGLGLQPDVAFCARLDLWDVAPAFRDGVITP